VALPDGHFHWLQSFINHYSLPAWQKPSDARSERRLPLQTVLHKLELIRVRAPRASALGPEGGGATPSPALSCPPCRRG
jgi:hypothetical protein